MNVWGSDIYLEVSGCTLHMTNASVAPACSDDEAHPKRHSLLVRFSMVVRSKGSPWWCTWDASRRCIRKHIHNPVVSEFVAEVVGVLAVVGCRHLDRM